MQVKHKYEENTFNALSFLLSNLQILKLFTGMIIILFKKKTIILHLKHVYYNAITHKIQDRQKIAIMSCNLKTTRYSPESYDCTYIVPRVNFLYEYDNYRTSGNTVFVSA
jgi:hypothetical protein